MRRAGAETQRDDDALGDGGCARDELLVRSGRYGRRQRRMQEGGSSSTEVVSEEERRSMMMRFGGGAQ
jgi:hypothetical protein